MNFNKIYRFFNLKWEKAFKRRARKYAAYYNYF